jgi:hypothetical protein
MNTTAPHLTNEPPETATPRPAVAWRRGSAPPERPAWGEVLAQVSPLIDAPAFFGPPIIFVLGPWLLLVLLLIPPAAFLITLVLIALISAALLAACAALLASPYLLVRYLRTRRGSRPHRSASIRRRAAPAVDDSRPHSGRAGWPTAPAAGGAPTH